jgi:cytochrome c oxidase subunit IV
MILLGASIWYAVSQQESANWPVLSEVNPMLVVALAFTVFLSTIFFPGMLFWLVTRPFVTTRRLDFFTMQGLIAGSALLNYTPVKAGLIGRVAYLRHFHGVGLRAAIVTHALVVGIFLVTCTAVFFLTVWRPEFGVIWAVSVIGVFSVLTIIGAPLLGVLIPSNVAVDPGIRDSRSRQMGFLALCFAIQILTLVATTIRWWLVFVIMGTPTSLADAWLAALVHMVTVMGGPANGLGFREWVIGFAAERGFFGMDTQLNLGTGVAASLVDRGVEAVVLIVLGLLGLILVRRGLSAGENGPD